MSNQDSVEQIEQDYMNDTSMSPENQKILQQAKQDQLANNKQTKTREGWIQKGENFFTFANYDNLPMEYKQLIPKQNKWKSPQSITDPFDGRKYYYGMTIFDNGGTSVWSRLDTGTTSAAGGSSGGMKKYFYKTIDVIEGSAEQIRAQLKAVNEGRTNSIKYVNAFPIKTVIQNPDGSKTFDEKIVHVMLLQERIEYG